MAFSHVYTCDRCAKQEPAVRSGSVSWPPDSWYCVRPIDPTRRDAPITDMWHFCSFRCVGSHFSLASDEATR